MKLLKMAEMSRKIRLQLEKDNVTYRERKLGENFCTRERLSKNCSFHLVSKKGPILSNQMVGWSITSVNLTKTVPFTPMQNGIWWIQKYVRSIRLVVHSTYIHYYLHDPLIQWFTCQKFQCGSICTVLSRSQECHRAEKIESRQWVR